MGLNIGFVSTRFAGIDGVSLEASKWARVLEAQGHACFWFAGELAKSDPVSLQVPQADFKDSQNQWVNTQLFGSRKKSIRLARMICNYKSTLSSWLKLFIHMYRIDLLVAENALSIPMHVPLGLALSDVIRETGLPTIAHHHDFYWERQRYVPLNGSKIYIHRAFPPRLPNIEHVVINSRAQNDLARRTKIASTLIPNVLDFDNPPVINQERIKALRNSIGLKTDDVMFLQPTRIVARKGIEFAIQLVKELNQPQYKLVVSHPAGDEGFEYARKMQALAQKQGVRLCLIHDLVDDPYADGNTRTDRFSLWEIYQAADFITYPSLYEGFGNALLEALYFKKPLLINRYQVFKDDIEPKGFDLVKMDGALTPEVISKVKNIIADQDRREKTVARNYRLAREHYSFSCLRSHFSSIISRFFPRQSFVQQKNLKAAALP